MNKATKIDLADLTDAIEHLEKLVPSMTIETKVDVAARLNGLVKRAETMQSQIKDEIKAQRHGKSGYVLGEIFKAFLNIIHVTRLNQEALKVEYPRAYAKCLETTDQQRITFEAR